MKKSLLLAAALLACAASQAATPKAAMFITENDESKLNFQENAALLYFKANYSDGVVLTPATFASRIDDRLDPRRQRWRRQRQPSRRTDRRRQRRGPLPLQQGRRHDSPHKAGHPATLQDWTHRRHLRPQHLWRRRRRQGNRRMGHQRPPRMVAAKPRQQGPGSFPGI